MKTLTFNDLRQVFDEVWSEFQIYDQATNLLCNRIRIKIEEEIMNLVSEIVYDHIRREIKEQIKHL
jgi:hypothetical protein